MRRRQWMTAALVLLCAGIGGCRIAADNADLPGILTDLEGIAELPDIPLWQPGTEKETAFVWFDGLANLLPKRWYAGDHGKKPTVKSQGKYGTCWALTATSALEATLLPEYDTVFSADHMALNNAFTVDVDTGGDYLMTMAYLSGWQGPVMEAEDPYGDGVSPDGLDAAVHVQEMQLLSGADLSEIKELVYEYGAVQTSLYMSRATTSAEASYYNEETAAYYYPAEEVANHDILVLGWDDTFSRFKFAQLPAMDGAFICQNTWGSDFGEDGIFYVSYADANILKNGIVYTKIESADNYDRIYQADDCGWQGRQGYASESCWFANVYTAGEGVQDVGETAQAGGENTVGETAQAGGENTVGETAQTGGENTVGETAQTGESNTVGETVQTSEENAVSKTAQISEATGLTEKAETESLAAVGFYATVHDTQYELYLVHDFESAEDFARMEYLRSGSMERPGYYTVELDETQEIAEGERFAVVVKITAPGETNPVAVEYRADEYTQNVTLEGKESYLSQYGEHWENTQERFGTNVCLKAYTTLEGR